MNDIDRAVTILKRGGLVGMPTETVYGLAADATNERAIAKVFSAKARPADHPLIVHVASPLEVPVWASRCPEGAWKLIDRFWPGPLTLILPKQPTVSPMITAGQSTVGIRCPDHPIALALLAGFEGALVAPSANRFGRISPTSAADVAAELGDRVDAILDGGPCPIGIESTVLDYSSAPPILLRPGHIGVEDIEAVCGEALGYPNGQPQKAPGTLPAHYAPATALLWLDFDSICIELSHHQPGFRLAAMIRSPVDPSHSSDVTIAAMPTDPVNYAKTFYRTLRRLDAGGFARILIEKTPTDATWAAINDRIARAVVGSNLEQKDHSV